MKNQKQKTQFAASRALLLAMTAASVGFLGACSQKKLACSGSKCLQAASIDPVTDAANRTKVGIMNFNQLQTNFTHLVGLDRTPPTGSTITLQQIKDKGTAQFYQPYGDDTRAGLRDSLPPSNRISEFSGSHQMSIQKNAFNACDASIDIDLMLYPNAAADTSGRKLVPNLPMTGLQEVATPQARTVVLNHMIDTLWVSGVSWTPTNDEALAVLLPLWDDMTKDLPKNRGDAEVTVLKTMCAVILASAPAMTL